MAKLFLVPQQPAEQKVIRKKRRPKRPKRQPLPNSFKVTGKTVADLHTALLAFAFLMDWLKSIGGPKGIRLYAEKVRAFRKTR
jgi:hypothetical protein